MQVPGRHSTQEIARLMWLHCNRFPVITVHEKLDQPPLRLGEPLREVGTQSDLCSRKMSPATGQQRKAGGAASPAGAAFRLETSEAGAGAGARGRDSCQGGRVCSSEPGVDRAWCGGDVGVSKDPAGSCGVVRSNRLQEAWTGFLRPEPAPLPDPGLPSPSHPGSAPGCGGRAG